MEKIISSKNQKVKQWKKLQTAKGRKEMGLYLLEGEHLYLEAVKNDVAISDIIMTETFYNKYNHQSGSVTLVSEEVMKVLSQTEHAQGVICIVSIPKEEKLTHLNGKFLLMDGVQDPGNAGTIVRTADAAGFQGVVFGTGSVDPYNDKVVRSMQGSQFHIPLYRMDLNELVPAFSEKGIPVYGTALDPMAKDYRDVSQSVELALVMGNEGNGVSSEVLDKTTHNLYIPIIGKAESLNVAVAAGILLYHFA